MSKRKDKLQHSGRGEYLRRGCKVLVRSHPEDEFIEAKFESFMAGGSEEEVDSGIYNCKLLTGEYKRFVECLLHFDEI